MRRRRRTIDAATSAPRGGMAAALALAALAAALLAAGGAAADAPDRPIPGLDKVGIFEHLDAQLPLDTVLVDEDSNRVKLGDFFNQGRPVILNLGYYACPMLCGLVLNGLLDGMKSLPWTPGQEFEIVTLSIDPREGPRLARLKKAHYLEEYGRPSAAAGWHFLTGDDASIHAVADTAGFGYVWNEESQKWMHQAALIVCTPDGRVSKYLYGVTFDPQTLRLSLVEATDGKIGSTTDKVLLLCFQYDASEGRYGPAARKLMTLGGYATLFAVLVLLAWLWRRDRRRKAQ